VKYYAVWGEPHIQVKAKSATYIRQTKKKVREIRLKSHIRNSYCFFLNFLSPCSSPFLK
jgi:hypothetical protein